jgi:preprotein translocase subunit SecE
MKGDEKGKGIKAIINYFQESYQELKKVTWPTRNQAIRLSFLVLGFCLVTALIVGAVDFGLSYGHQFMIDYGAQNPLIISGDTANVNESLPADVGQEIPVTGTQVVTKEAAPVTVNTGNVTVGGTQQ